MEDYMGLDWCVISDEECNAQQLKKSYEAAIDLAKIHGKSVLMWVGGDPLPTKKTCLKFTFSESAFKVEPFYPPMGTNPVYDALYPKGIFTVLQCVP